MPAAFKDAAVQAVFDQYEADVRDKLLSLRKLIFDQAALIPSVGPLSERLKWGQPAYRPHCKQDWHDGAFGCYPRFGRGCGTLCSLLNHLDFRYLDPISGCV